MWMMVPSRRPIREIPVLIMADVGKEGRNIIPNFYTYRFEQRNAFPAVRG
jgi:hypothetical protein